MVRVTGLVRATGGAMTIVGAAKCAGSPASAAASASTKAPHEGQRSVGFLARPRMITASTAGPKAECRALGGDG